MSTPVGHTIVGLALARRLGVRSPGGLLAAVLLSNLPDIDVPVSMALRGDPWILHRRASHSFTFALLAGGAAGALGRIPVSEATEVRDPFQDAVRGAIIVGSHVVLDRLPYRSIRIGPRFLGMRLTNWLLDAAQCLLIARLLEKRSTVVKFGVRNTIYGDQIRNP